MEILTFLELLGCGGHECESQDRMVEPVPSPFISLPVRSETKAFSRDAVLSAIPSIREMVVFEAPMEIRNSGMTL